MSKNFSDSNSKFQSSKISFQSSDLMLNNLAQMNSNFSNGKNNIFNDEEENLGFKTTFNFQRKSSTSSDSNSAKNVNNNNNVNNNVTFNENNNFYYNERKLSSPIFSYYNESEKYFSRLKNLNKIDFSKSNNFIEKEKIRTKSFNEKSLFLNNNNNNNNNDNNVNNNVNNINTINNNNLFNLSSFYYPNLNYYYYNSSFNYSNNNSYSNNILRKSSSNMNININNNNYDFYKKLNKKNNKPFVERTGDWTCAKCKNLNFAFRIICNRCHLEKEESEKMFLSNS